MTLVNIEANDLGLDNLGRLRFDSAWSTPGSDYWDGLLHTTETKTIFTDPEHVLYWRNLWGRNENGINSLKRFSYMLKISAVALLDSPIQYESSLRLASHVEGRQSLSGQRFRSLLRQTERYIDITSDGTRVSRLATSTVRILFGYEPPSGEPLTLLHDRLMSC